MTTVYLALVALVLSTIPIVRLCAGDPKRQRTLGARYGGMAPAQRRLLGAAACVPGLICALLGDAAAFLIWLGGCALVGWILAAYWPAHLRD